MGGVRALWERLVEPHPFITDPAQRRSIRLLLSVCVVMVAMQALSLLSGSFGNQATWMPGYSQLSLVVQNLGSLLVGGLSYVLAATSRPRRGVLSFIIGMEMLMWWSLYLATGYSYHDALLVFLLIPMGAAAILERPTFNLVLTLLNTAFIVVFQLNRFATPEEALAVSIGAGAVLMAGLLLTLVSNYLVRDAQRIADQTADLAAREQRFRTVANESGEGMIVSRDGVILFANPAAARIFGLPPGTLEGKSSFDLVDPVSHDAIRKRLAVPGESTAELELVRRDGVRLVLRSHARQLPFEGGMARFANLRDITAERRTMQLLESAKHEAEAAAKAKNDFLAMMSHEIRTPMNAMVGYADLMRGTKLDAGQAEMVSGLRDSGARLITLVDNMMDFAKAEQGRLKTQQAPCDVGAVVAEVVRLLSEYAKSKGTRVSIEGNGGAKVLSDAPRLQQVIHNLVDNAIKFSEKGSVVVRVAASPVPAGREVTVEVKDSGIGMDPAMLARLFHPFSQADQGMTRRFGGTGLGLAVSQRLAHALGGAITVQSEPGKGSTFTFRFTAPAAEAVPQASPDAPPAALPPMRILVAEDNPTNQKVLALMLQRLGQKAELVDDGEKAVSAAVGDHFDVVLMDVHMPRMDGLEATRRIRATGKPVRIVAVTADALAGDREKCLEAGMDDYVPKPVRLEDLHRILARKPS